MQHLPSIYVFTHDSIGLGEDGPTHQPIEQLAHLRATPNLYMVRPAGANETALAWRFALEQTDAPDGDRAQPPGAAGVEPERACPTTRSSAAPTCCANRTRRATPDVILIGTGSEVHICTRGRRPARGGRDRHARRLRALPRALRRAGRGLPRQVLPPRVRGARRRSRPAATFGWERWIGDDGDSGRHDDASAPPAPQKDALRALRLHGRERRRPRAGGRSSGWGRVHERRRGGQRAARGAHRGRHERLARPDPAQPDRERRARAARRARTRCAA